MVIGKVKGEEEMKSYIYRGYIKIKGYPYIGFNRHIIRNTSWLPENPSPFGISTIYALQAFWHRIVNGIEYAMSTKIEVDKYYDHAEDYIKGHPEEVKKMMEILDKNMNKVLARNKKKHP